MGLCLFSEFWIWEFLDSNEWTLSHRYMKAQRGISRRFPHFDWWRCTSMLLNLSSKIVCKMLLILWFQCPYLKSRLAWYHYLLYVLLQASHSNSKRETETVTNIIPSYPIDDFTRAHWIETQFVFILTLGFSSFWFYHNSPGRHSLAWPKMSYMVCYRPAPRRGAVQQYTACRGSWFRQYV